MNAIALLLCCWASAAYGHTVHYSPDMLRHPEKQVIAEKVQRDLFATIEKNIRENSRKIKLNDFRWGIFSGSQGRLEGIQFQLVNDKTVIDAHGRYLNMTFESTVPRLRVTWDKSVCTGFQCAMTIELRKATFVLRMVFDGYECVAQNLFYLDKFEQAQCQASYDKSNPMATNLVDSTINLLTKVLNTETFINVVKEKVNYALLQLPLFSTKEIVRICNGYKDF